MAHKIWNNHKTYDRTEWRMRDDYIPPQAKNKHRKETLRIIENWEQGTNIWHIKGKYQGKQMRELPLYYLKWIGLNFDMHSNGFKVAVQELERRASNTQG